MTTRETTRPLVTLMTHFASDLAYLVQTEFRLARAEMGEKLSAASNAGVYLALGGVIALGGFITLLFDIAHWIAAAGLSYEWNLLIVAGVALVIGAALTMAGVTRRKGLSAHAQSHSRAGAGGLCRSKGARAMTAFHERRHVSRLSTSGDYEREAEQTRRRLAQNLDELSDRLTPGQVFDELLTYSRAGGGTFFRAFNNAMRENPLPSLLIGAGCMMFLSEKMGLRARLAGKWRQADDGDRRDSYDAPADRRASRDAAGPRRTRSPGRQTGSATSSARSAAASVQSGLGSATEAASRQTMNAASAVADTKGGRRRQSATLPQARPTLFAQRPMTCAIRLPARSIRCGAAPRTQRAPFAKRQPRRAARSGTRRLR